jgi:stage II sporulation protein D
MLRTVTLLIAGMMFASAAVATSTNWPPSEIRVRLLEQQINQQVRLAGRSSALLLFADDGQNPIVRLQPGEEATFSARDGQIHIGLTEGGIFSAFVRVESEGESMHLQPDRGREGQWIAYEGRLSITPDPSNRSRLLIVSHVPLERYVGTVVGGEYGLDDVEGARAQAVVARTFALRNVGRFGSYDVVDHVGSQVYHGLSHLTPQALEAAMSTAGEVLTHNGELIQAYYSSSSGGHTSNNESIWTGGRPLPYLRGRPDPYDDLSPHRTWRSTVPRDRLLRALTEARGHEVTGFFLGDKAPDGRVVFVDLLDGARNRRQMSANEFRMIVNRVFGVNSLKSTAFEATRQGSDYVFEGRGFGHGVGMSQWGAHSMARRGYTYRQILDFYYSGVALAHLDNIATPLPVTEPAVAPVVADLSQPPEIVPEIVQTPPASRPVQEQVRQSPTTRTAPAAPARPVPTEPLRRPSGRRVGW